MNTKLIIGLHIVVAVVIGFILYSVVGKPQPTVEQKTETVKVEKPVPTAQEIHRLVNVERTKRNIAPLEEHPALNASAQEKCDDMVKQDYQGHINPQGNNSRYFINKHSNPPKSYENLVQEFHSSEHAVYSWMQSKAGHREGLLDSAMTHVGTGLCKSEDYMDRGPAYLAVQHFGQL